MCKGTKEYLNSFVPFFNLSVILHPRACLKTHCTVLNAPLCGILRRDYGKRSPLRLPNHSLSSTNCSIQSSTSSFQTHPSINGFKNLSVWDAVIYLYIPHKNIKLIKFTYICLYDNKLYCHISSSYSEWSALG
jgi:hypothetical protein